MTKSRQVVVFDWNGTLFDDTVHCLRATNTILEHFGIQSVSIERYRNHCRVPIAHMYEDFGLSMEELSKHKSMIHDLWNSVYNSHAKTASLRNGAVEALNELKQMGHRSIILSNHTIANISLHTERFGIREHFEVILAYENYGAAFLRHVKGERLKHYLKEQKIEHGVIIGDSEEEIHIARDHGFVSVAIKDGVCSTERLKAANPDFLVDSLEEIPGIIAEAFEHKRKLA